MDARLISTVIALPLLVFWAWMFWDMTNNDSLPGNSKSYWTIAFIFFNIFAAAYYFVEYKNRR